MDEDDLSTGEDDVAALGLDEEIWNEGYKYGFGTTSDAWPTVFNSHFELGIENGPWTNEDGEEVQSDPDSDHD